MDKMLRIIVDECLKLAVAYKIVLSDLDFEIAQSQTVPNRQPYIMRRLIPIDCHCIETSNRMHRLYVWKKATCMEHLCRIVNGTCNAQGTSEL
jgi:hypothetical protein